MNRLFLIAWIIALTVIAFGFSNLELSITAENFTSNRMIEGNLSNQGQPSIALDTFGNIYIVWHDNRNDEGDTYFAKSIDGGLSLSIAQKVSDDLGTAEQNVPSVAVDSKGIIHVIWEDWRNDDDGRRVGSDGGIDSANNGDIYYANSTDGGITWSTNKMINDDSGTKEQGRPDIAIDNNDVIHIVWRDNRLDDDPLNPPNYFDIYYANSTDGGVSFSVNERITDVMTYGTDPAIAVDDKNNIHVVWADGRNSGTTGPDIYYANSTDGGITFSSNKRVSDDTTDTYQYWPDIAAGGGIIGIVWDDARENSLYFANSTDGGITFSPNRRVNSFTGGLHQSGSIAINNNGYICVAWEGSGIDIYFANSTDGGATFSPSQRVNDDTGTDYQRLPSLALRNRTVYIAWQDNRNDNFDIYFARSNIPPPMAMPISPLNDSTITDYAPTLEVTSVTDLDNDTVYYNFIISDQPDAESGTNHSSGWIISTSWTTPPLLDGKWYWHTYTSDMWNTTSPNWVWNFTVDANLQSYGVPLNEGWNLISIPLIQPDTDLSNVLFSITGSYDAMEWYNVSENSGHWKIYHTSKPSHLNDLYNIDHTMGFWIHVTEPGGVLFQCYGIQPTENQSIALHPGWNLVGYPSTTNKTRTTALSKINFGTEVDSIWTYNASMQKWEEIGLSDYFERGRGYWIHAKTDCVWEVPL